MVTAIASPKAGHAKLAARPEKRNVGGIEHRSGYALPALDAPNIKWPGFAPPNGRLLIRRCQVPPGTASETRMLQQLSLGRGGSSKLRLMKLLCIFAWA